MGYHDIQKRKFSALKTFLFDVKKEKVLQRSRQLQIKTLVHRNIHGKHLKLR